MLRTPHFELPYFLDGDFFSEIDDEERAVAIDHLLKGMADIVGEGIIDGWKINDEGGITVSVSAGKGFIDSKYSRSANDIDLVLVDDACNYIYVTRNSNQVDAISASSNYVSVDFTDTDAPASPSDLIVEESESRRVLLSWSPNLEADFDSYNLERKKASESIYENLGRIYNSSGSSGKIYYEDIGLDPNTTYNYRLSAIDVSGNVSAYSIVDQKTAIDLVPPPEVTEVTVKVSSKSFSIYWKAVDVDDFDSYVVVLSRLDESGNVISSITADIGKELYYHKNGLSNNVVYRVAIRAKDIYGNISSGIIKEITPVYYPGPLDVSGITYSITNIGRPLPITPKITLSWLASISVDVSGYNIYVIEDGVQSEKISVGNFLTKEISLFPNRVNSVVVNKIFSDKKDYVIKITAEDSSGKESAGAYIKVFIPNFTPPNDVKNLKATAGDSEMSFVWDSSDSSDFDHYEFYWWKLSDESDFIERVNYNSFTSNVFTLSSPLTKSFPVGSWVDLSVPPSSGAPNLKMFLTVGANVGDTTIQCDFIPVYYASTGSLYLTDAPAYDEFSGRNFYIKTGLDNGEAYKFMLMSVNSSGIKSSGVLVTATPTSEVFTLNSPSLISEKSGNAEATISWAGVVGVEGYKVYRAGPLSWDSDIAPESEFSLLTTVSDASQTEITDIDLENNNRYAYVVVTYSGRQESEFDYERQVITRPLETASPLPPTNVTATGVSGSVTIEWSFPSDITGIEGWELYRSTHKYYGYELVDSFPFSIMSYVDKGLENGLVYYYFVRSFSNTVDISSSLSSSTPLKSIYIGKVKTESGDIVSITENRSIIYNLDEKIKSLTAQFVKDHKHSSDAKDEFSTTREQPLKINLSKNDDFIGFSTVDYRVYTSAKNIVEDDNYVVLINSDVSPVLYNVDFDNNKITFDQVLYVSDGSGLYSDPPEISLRFFDQREVQGVLDSRLIDDIDASKIITGQINKGLLPEISHQGRIEEHSVVRSYNLLSQNNIFYDLSVTSYIVNGETVRVSLGNSFLFYCFVEYGASLYGSSNRGFLKSNDGGLTWNDGATFDEVIRFIYKQQNSEEVYFAVGQKTVYISSDFDSWFAMKGTEAVTIIHDITEDANGNIYIATDTGIYIYDQDFILTYRFRATNLITIDSISSEAYSVFSSGGNDIVVSTEDGMFKTANKGLSWVKISSVGPFVKVMRFNGDLVGIDHNLGYLYKSVDNGVTWEVVPGFSGLTGDSVFTIISNRIYYTVSDGVFYSDDLSEPFRIGGDFNLRINKQGARAIYGISKTDVIISFDNKIYRYRNGETSLWASFAGAIPSVFKNGKLVKHGYYYDSVNNNIYFEYKNLYDDIIEIAVEYSEYFLDNGGWQDIDSDDCVVDLFVNSDKIGSISSLDIEDENIETDNNRNIVNKKYVFSYGSSNTITINSQDGKIDVAGPQFNKFDEIVVSIKNVAFTNEGSNTHNELQDALDKNNVGLPYCLSNVYLDSMLQVGLFSEHNFVESIRSNTIYPYSTNNVVRSFNSELINSEFFIFGRKYYDVFNSTIDYNDILSNDNVSTSPFVINLIREVNGETWIATDIGIYVLTQDRTGVKKRLDIASGVDVNVTGIVEDDDVVYVVASNKIYFSDDYGEVWAKNSGFGLNGKLFEIDLIRNFLLVSSDSGLYFSNKGSDEWRAASFFNASNDKIEISTNIDSLIVSGFAFCLIDNKVYRSVNGVIWNEIYNFESTGVLNIVASKLYPYRNNILALTNKGLYTDVGSMRFSSNSFFDRIKLESSDPDVSVKSISSGENRVVVVSGKNNLYVSTDYGYTWVKQTVSIVSFLDVCHIWPEIRLTADSIDKIEKDGVPMSVIEKLTPIIDIIYDREYDLDLAVSALLTETEYNNDISTILNHSKFYDKFKDIFTNMADLYKRNVSSSFDFFLDLGYGDRIFENDLRQIIDVPEPFDKISLYLFPTKYGTEDFSITVSLFGVDDGGNIDTGVLSSDIKSSGELFNPGWYNFRLSYDGPPRKMALVVRQNYGDSNNFSKWMYADKYYINGFKNLVQQDYPYSFILWKFENSVDIDGQFVQSLPAISEESKPLIGGGEFYNTVFEDNKVKLSSDDKLISVIIDESGSMTWNDQEGSRFDLIKSFARDLHNVYPADLKYAIVTYGGKILNVIKSEIINKSDMDIYGSSFRVVRRSDRYPTSPLDGVIVSETGLTVAKDDTVVSGTTYYYGIFNIKDDSIYSSGQFDKITVNERSIPLPVSNLLLASKTIEEAIGVPVANKDTGKRVVSIRFNTIENFSAYYSDVRILRKKCNDDSDKIENANDGDIVYEGIVTAGENSIIDDFGGLNNPINGVSYCYAIYTKNSIGNYCLPKNSIQSVVVIPAVWREWEFDSGYNSTYIPAEFLLSPLDVEDFRVDEGYKQNKISWTIPSGGLVAGVVLYASETAITQLDPLSFSHENAIRPEWSLSSASDSVIKFSVSGDKIYEGDGVSFIHRNLENGRKYFYRIYTYNRVRTLSAGDVIGEGVPSSDIDDNFEPPNSKDFYAEIFNNNTVILRWNAVNNEPIKKFYFDDIVNIRTYALDEAGVPTDKIKDFNFSIDSAVKYAVPSISFDDNDENDKNDESVNSKLKNIISADCQLEGVVSEKIQSDEYLFVPDATSYAGELRAATSISVNNISVLSGYLAYVFNIYSKYTMSGEKDSSFTEFSLMSNKVSLEFCNPLKSIAFNKFPESQTVAVKEKIVDPLTGLVDIKISYNDGVYSNSGKSYFGEIEILFKDAALTDKDQASVTAELHDFNYFKKLKGNVRKKIWKQEISKKFSLASTEIELVTEESQKEIITGESTETSNETKLRTVGQFQILPSDNSGLVMVVFDISVNGYTSRQEHEVNIKSILNLELNASAPIADGRDVAEQMAISYVGPPSYDTKSKEPRVPVQDGVLVKWKMVKEEFGKDRPFYSTESIPLDGIYSSIVNGTARNVFFGPASDVKPNFVIDSETKLPKIFGENYKLEAKIVYKGMSATVNEELSLWPISKSLTSHRFYMTNNYNVDGEFLFADGRAYSTVEIHGNPAVTGGAGGAKFLDCLASQGIEYIPLFEGQRVTIEDLAISVKGDFVSSFIYNDIEYDTLSEIPIVLDENGRADFKLKINAFIGPPPEVEGAPKNVALKNPCYGFIPPDSGYPPFVSVFGTTQTTLAGRSITMSGGGDREKGIPPVIVTFLEPLAVSYRKMMANSRLVLNPPNDGVNSTEIFFELTFANGQVPDGTQVDFKLIYGDATKDSGENKSLSIDEINALPKDQRRLYYGGFNSYTELLKEVSLENVSGIVRNVDGKSLVSAILKPTRVRNNVQFTIVATSTYDALGTINRSMEASHVISFGSKEIDGFNVYEASVERFDTTSESWIKIDQMNEGRAGHICEINVATNKIYSVGGLNDSGLIGDVEEFTYHNASKTPDVEGSYGEWVVKNGKMEYPRAFSQSVIKDGVIYLFGGFGYNPFGTTGGYNSFSLCEKYDILSDTWTAIAEMPNAVSHGVAELVGDNVYVFSGLKSLKPYNGGNTFNEFNSTIMRYNITNDEWAVLEELDPVNNLLKRISPFSYVKNGKIYVFGGIASEYNYKDPESADFINTLIEVDVTDENNILFTEVAYSGEPISRFRGGCRIVDDNFYIIGGSGNKKITIGGLDRIVGTDTLKAVEVLDTSTNLWKTYKSISKMSKERHSLGVVDDVDFIYAVGGVSSGYGDGKLMVTMTLSSNNMRADGRDQISAALELSDVTGEPAPDGVKVVINGFVIMDIGDKENAEKIPSESMSINNSGDGKAAIKQLSDRVSVYPVIFSSSEVFTLDGVGATIILPRSEDPMKALSSLYQYSSGKDDVIGQVYDEESDSVLVPPKTKFEVEVGVERALYSIVIEALVEDDFYNGGLDTDAALKSNADKIVQNSSLGEGNSEKVFSLSSFVPKHQQESPIVDVFNDMGWIPEVDSTYGITGYNDFVDAIDLIKQKIPFGGSPHWDAVVETTQNVLKDSDYSDIGKVVIDVSDNEENLSMNSIDTAISQLHLVNGYQKTPVFTNSFVVAKPPSLSARANRAETIDLEKLSGETNGLSHTILDDSYIPIIVKRMKIGSVGAIGTGLYSQVFDLGSVVSITDIRANFELYDFTNGLVEIYYSADGYNYTLSNQLINPNVNETVVIKARYVKFVIKLTSQFGDAELIVPSPPPAFLDISFGYSKPKKQYIFTYAKTADSFIRQIYITVNGNIPLSSEVHAGMTHSTSTNWADYSTSHQKTVDQSGRIVSVDASLSLLNLDQDIENGGRTQYDRKTRAEIETMFIVKKEDEYGKIIDRIIVIENKTETSSGRAKIIFADKSEIIVDESPDYSEVSDLVSITEKDQTKYVTSGTVLNYNLLQSDDGYIYNSSYGPWQPESVVNVYRNGVVVSKSEYVEFQHAGIIKFHERQDISKNMAIEVALSPEYRIGIEITNKDKRHTTVLDEFAYMYNSNYIRSANLFNGVPTVSNLSLSPLSANPTDTFVANYTYSDPNGEPEKDSIITWYLNNGIVNELQDFKEWNINNLIKRNLNNGDKIYFTVRPSNGSVSGPLAVSPSLIVGDIPPVINGLQILPIINGAVVSQYTSSVDLGVSYTYSDSKGRAESGTVIEWYLNDEPISFRDVENPNAVVLVGNRYRTTNDILVIEKTNYLKVKVTPSNGVTKGLVYESSEVVIENSAPVLNNVELTPTEPDVNSVLTVSYEFFDRDDDIDSTLIKWYKNGELVDLLNNRRTVSSEFTALGEAWFAEIIPSDGETDGDAIRTSTVIIASE